MLRETPEGHIVLQRRRKRDRRHGAWVIEHLQARVAPDGQSAQVLQGARFTWKDAQIHSLVTPAATWSFVLLQRDATFYSVCQKSPPTRAPSAGSA